MKQVQGVNALATAALLIVVITACSNSGPDPAATGSTEPPAQTATSPSSTPTQRSDSQVASDAASALVRKYYAVRDELGQDPKVPLSELRSTEIGIELAADQQLFKKERQEGLHQTGDTKIAKLIVQAVTLDNDPQSGRVPTVQVDVCYDVTDVDLVDAQGKSRVKPSRPETGWIRYFVSNYHYAADPTGSWRVASGKNLERTPCDPA